jgi:hypothetical protein
MYVAGVEPAGLGRSLDAAEVTVLTDPGPVVFSFTKEGLESVEVRKNLAPGSVETMPISMRDYPATIQVRSNLADAVVRLDNRDVGAGSLSISRPKGTYELIVSRDGYNDFRTSTTLLPGQTTTIDAVLTEYKTPITKRWWFWTAAAGVLAGVGIATYFVVRPAPTRPPIQTGGLGWAAEIP